MLSIVIPALNEEQALPATLDALLKQTTDEEIIVVDGGSTDKTRSICQQFSQIKLIDSKRGRATQMNAGAASANGEILLFLHADTLLPKDALQTINKLITEDLHSAGGFKHSFGNEDWRLQFISFLDNRRCMQTRIIYGDQAMFIRRDLFEKLNGFPDVGILEDVIFCEKLVKHTIPVITDSFVNTDPRKFIKMGIWRSLYRVIAIQIKHELRLPVANDHPFFAEIR